MLRAPHALGADVFRALAIVLVMTWHLPRAATPAVLVAFKSYAWTGVDIFFVLSGYLIGKQLLEPVARGAAPSLREFYLRRSLRILPAFLVRQMTRAAVAIPIGLSLVLLAAMLFHYPAGPFVAGPALSLAGASLGYPLLSAGVAWLLGASLQWRPRVGFGLVTAIATLSYSLYLTHKLASHANQSWFSPHLLNGSCGLALYFMSSLILAAVLWWLVERPFLRWRERLLGRKS